MTRDESIYSEPDRFNPDRFFTADGKLNSDDTVLAFGLAGLVVPKIHNISRLVRFGRRICVGRHNADAIVWAAIVSVLSTFNIAPAKDANGNEIDADYSDGLIRCVRLVAKRYGCSQIIKPSSAVRMFHHSSLRHCEKPGPSY
jgi:hypothetical protein